jgi:DNA-binding transcriptional ArsR family regulator
MMNFRKIISALDSETRVQIIKILGRGPATTTEIFQEIKKVRKVSVGYRESIYRALEKLVDADLVDKYYDKKKGICYKLLMRKIKLDLIEGTVEEIE